jgi:hypothetical protein
MALAAGVETWHSNPLTVAALVGGLGLVAAGGTVLGGSHTVARVSGRHEHVTTTPRLAET